MHVIEPWCSWSWRLTITSISTMSERWEAVSATQITRSGATPTGTLATQVADHIGGDARMTRLSCAITHREQEEQSDVTLPTMH
jgi:hypothetical protein